MLKNAKFWAILGSSLVIGSVVGYGGYAVAEVMRMKKDASATSFPQNTGYERKFYDDENKIGFQNVKIKNYKILNPATGKWEYFFNDVGINYLIKRFCDTVIFGPEIGALKSISLGNMDVTSPKEKGLYIPATREIFLNPDPIINKVNTSISEYNKNYDVPLSKDDIEKIKAESMFQVLFHEYSHHLMTVYPASNFAKSSIKVTSLTDSDWNSTFVDRFTSIFGYDKDFSKPTQYADIQNYKGDIVANINALYNTKELFEYANKDAPLQDYQSNLGETITDFLFFSPIKSRPALKGNHDIMEFHSLASKDNLKYLYSIDELTVRKLLQASMTVGQYYDYLIKSMAASSSKDQLYMTDLLDELSKTDLFITKTSNQDALLKNFQSNNDPSKTFHTNRFMFDNVFKNDDISLAPDKNKFNAKSYVDLVDEAIGHDTGSDVSFISSKNDMKAVSSEKINFDTNILSAMDNINMGGYIDDSKFLNADNAYLGYSDNGKFISVAKIYTHKHNIGYKEGPFKNTKVKVDGEKYLYYSDYFNSSLITNRSLSIALKQDDGTFSNKYELSSYRGQEVNEMPINAVEGYASSYNSTFASIVEKELKQITPVFYPFINQSGEIQLKREIII